MRTVIKAYTLSECMDAMAEYVQAFEKQGQKNVIFCEDRLTLIAERALMRKLGGSILSSVTTFARFLKTDASVLSKQGSVMAIGSIMTKLQKEGKLKCFKSSASVSSNAKYIYETIAQFAASDVTGETLDESLNLLPEDLLKRKVGDLKEIYSEYENMLEESGYVDESKYLSLLPLQIIKDKSLKDANVFFLCYSSFTAQAQKAIRAVCQTAKSVVGVFCDGEEEIYTHRASTAFENVLSEYGKYNTVQYGKPLAGEAEVLRSGLYNPEKLSGKENKYKTDKIRIFEGANVGREAEYVAGQIAKKMQENENLRYRDFAVLVPDIATYSLPLKKAFADYKIPGFFDEKKSLKNHPLSEFVLACLEYVLGGYSSDDAQALAQNYFFGESDNFRNYLLKYGNYRRGALNEIKDVPGYDFAELEVGRERFLTIIKLIKKEGTGREYTAAIRRILADFSVYKRLEELEKKVDDVTFKGYLAQIAAALEKVLLEAELLLTGQMTVSQFHAVLSEGLNATEISLIPLKSDAVFVGGIVTSRIEKVCVLFALGLTDQVPDVTADTALISDMEIRRLAAVKTLLEPTVAEVNLRHRENVCLNLCTFMDSLYLTYPVSDGDVSAVSEILRYTSELFKGEEEKIKTERGVALSELPYYCAEPRPAVRRMIVSRAEFLSRKRKDHVVYDSLFEALKEIGIEMDESDYDKKRFDTVDGAAELLFSGDRVSPSTLEKYFACPFRNFLESGLKIKQRDESSVLSTDSGTFIHELLKRTSKKLKSLEKEEDVESLAKNTMEEIFEQKPTLIAQEERAHGVYFRKRLVKEGTDVLLAVFRQIKNSDYDVEYVEKSIRTDEFKGQIDRVDVSGEFVRIIDYKTGGLSSGATEFYTGQKLQLPLYMTAVSEGKRAAGILYFPASNDFREEKKENFEMIGYVNSSPDALQKSDKNFVPTDKTPVIQGQKATLLSEQDFCDFIDYSVQVAKKAKDEMKDGYVAANPYEGKCSYCKYGGICGFNKVTEQPRREPNIKAERLAEIARERKKED